MKKRIVMDFHKLSLFLLLGISLLWGCHSRSQPPDVSHIPMEVHISRFDRDFMSVDTLHTQRGLKKLRQKFPVFYPIYINKIMQFHLPPGSHQNVGKDTIIRQFITNKDIRQLQHIVDQKFASKQIKQIQNQLKQSFRYIKYYFPDFTPPQVITFTSAMSNYGAITIDSLLGIGLDMFLGRDFSLYQKVSPPYPDYILPKFDENNLIPSCIKVIAQNKFPPPKRGTLLDQMIAHGKVLYFMDRVLPHTADSLKINYTTRQLKWCKRNEQFIWQYFIQKNLLYNKKPLTIRYYIGAAPTSRGMPSEAPGNVGSWTGWQIVKSYMEKHPKTSLKKLMKKEKGQLLLNTSGYQPH